MILSLDQKSFLTKMPDWLLHEMEIHLLALIGSERNLLIHWTWPGSVRLVLLKGPLFSSVGQCYTQYLVTLLIKWDYFDSLCNWVIHVCNFVIALFNRLCGFLGKERMPENIAASIPHKSQVTGQIGAFQRWKFLSALKLWRQAVPSEVVRVMNDNELGYSAFYRSTNCKGSSPTAACLPFMTCPWDALNSLL